MEIRETDITNLIPVKQLETYMVKLKWKNVDGKYRLFLITTVGDLPELKNKKNRIWRKTNE